MDLVAQLKEVQERFLQANQDLEAARTIRATLIQYCHHHAGMAIRDIAGHVSLSQQRVYQIIHQEVPT